MRKDNFPKNYGLLPDGHIPADPPKDAPWLREERKEGRKKGGAGWLEPEGPVIYDYLHSGQAQRP